MVKTNLKDKDPYKLFLINLLVSVIVFIDNGQFNQGESGCPIFDITALGLKDKDSH